MTLITQHDPHFEIDCPLLFAFILKRFRSLVPMYYRGAHGAIIVYDIQSRESFNCAKSWVQILRQEVIMSV